MQRQNTIENEIKLYPNLDQILAQQNELNPEVNVYPTLDQILAEQNQEENQTKG